MAAGRLFRARESLRQRAGAPQEVPQLGRALLLFNLSRAGIFLVSALLVFTATRLNGLPLLFAALALSVPLSLFLQKRQRDALGRALEAKAKARTARTAALRARLDESDPS